jgi:ribosome-associated toxin RatA of RatAB toxin-antitoxin module
MIELKEEITVSPEALFDLTQDYGQRMNWDPFPESYKLLNKEVVEEGLHVEIKAKNGLSMVVEYVSFNRPKVVAIKMIKGPWFIKRFAGSWSFHKESENISIVKFKYNISGNPEWASVIITPVIQYVFGRNAKQRLVALKKYAEYEYKNESQ